MNIVHGLAAAALLVAGVACGDAGGDEGAVADTVVAAADTLADAGPDADADSGPVADSDSGPDADADADADADPGPDADADSDADAAADSAGDTADVFTGPVPGPVTVSARHWRL
ncbi:MAG: hypothetical protein KC635_28930, partial [Myxococcales bacterium]|nr:hypothetical protein [Myxococcales bacterium]